jgi:hypothetical protein
VLGLQFEERPCYKYLKDLFRKLAKALDMKLNGAFIWERNIRYRTQSFLAIPGMGSPFLGEPQRPDKNRSKSFNSIQPLMSSQFQPSQLTLTVETEKHENYPRITTRLHTFLVERKLRLTKSVENTRQNSPMLSKRVTDFRTKSDLSITTTCTLF